MLTDFLFMLIIVQLLFAVHWLLDYPLQGDFLANTKFGGLPPNGDMRFYHLVAHAGIQGAGVTVVLLWFIGPVAVIFGLAEWVAHILIDEAKVRDKISYADDQALHLCCKMIWTIVLFLSGLLA